MSALSIGALRLKHGDSYILAVPPETPDAPYTIRVTDAFGRPVGEDDRRAALEHLLKELSALRTQVYEMLRSATRSL